MKKIILSLFLVIVSLICSCNSASGSSINNESSSKISSSISSNSFYSFPLTKEEQKVIEKDALSMVEFSTRTNSIPMGSLNYGGSFKLNLKNDNVVFELNSDVVELTAKDTNGQSLSGRNITIGKDILIYFDPLNLKESVLYLGFINVIAKINDNITTIRDW